MIDDLATPPRTARAGDTSAVGVLGTVPITSPRERYWPELDGLRAVAVLLVIGYHAGLSLVPGGSVGVDVFFTLSGFLITTVLLEEYSRKHTFGLRHFYVRRVLRLYPAMLFALLGAVVFAGIIGGVVWDRTLVGVPLALTYTLNWFRASGSRFGLIGHLWSLCVEEQFYLVWPAVMLVSLRRGPRAALFVAAAITLFCTALTPVLYEYGGVDRLYFGSDARAPQLLMGAIAALVYFQWRPTPMVRRLLSVGATLGVCVIALDAHGSLSGGFWVSARFIVLAAAVALLVVHLVDAPARIFTFVLAWRPSVALGRISYAMYLWYWPLVFTIRYFAPSMRPPVLFAIVLPATIGISYFSYQVVELRFLRLKNRIAVN